MKTLVVQVKNFAMPDMRFTYTVANHVYTLISSEYLFLGNWIEFEEKDHRSLCEFLYLVIESDNIRTGFNDNGCTITGVTGL